MPKLKKRLLDDNDSIARTPEDAFREWQDEIDEAETINVEIHDEDYDDWCEYMQKFYKTMEEIDKDNEIAQQQKLRPTWHDMYMQIAEVVAQRSKDPHTKVGAVIVKDFHILGIGYNAEPKGFAYNFDWNSSEKYDYVIHAELNAIANSTFFGNSIAGSTIYLTLSPCKECMKLIAQYGIKTVYYKKRYKDFEKSERFAKYANINLIQYSDIS